MAIETLLIANRGEIACRIIRTAREMGIRTVAVFSDPDRDAPHVALADVAVSLPGSTAGETYLDQTRILDAARRTGADALHPGYGFLAENAVFAAACAQAGITFVGPSPEAVREMGLKDRAKELASSAEVPVLADAPVAGDNPEDWAAAARRVGYPLLVKATAGGGGRGMRRVDDPDGLADAVEAARREAAAAFGDSQVFLERFVPAARHIEIQIVGDVHGNVVHLFERECSVQRRHQKVLEEAPSPAVTPSLRARMAASAVALARTLDYVGAGTVEFLVDGAGDGAEFAFLEMNTRLQVEHPVTEAVTGIDLVRLQLLVASGEALPVGQEDITVTGHAVEARLYAENAAAGFSPTFGPLWRYEHGSHVLPGLRYEDGVSSGSEVSTLYDAMLSKVVAHAPTRGEACARLARALSAMRLHGPKTNRDFLVRVLRSPEFQAGQARTDFVESHPELCADVCDEGTAMTHLAAVVVATATRRRAASVVPAAPPGWRLFPDEGREATWSRRDGEEVTIRYTLADDALTLTVAGQSRRFGFSVAAGGTRVQVTLDDVQRTCSVHHEPDGTVWIQDGETETCWVEEVRLPVPGLEATAGAPVAELPGTIVAVLVKPGDVVAAGDPLVILEAMKMEHRVTAPSAGVVEAVRVSPGQRVDAHEILVELGPAPAQ